MNPYETPPSTSSSSTPPPVTPQGNIWKQVWEETKSVVLKIINLRETTDFENTIDDVRKSIAIRGYNVWILACAAMLASIGLDKNSSAVIIGAMLISPLMSPILGIGASLAINDRKHLFLALENFSIAVGAVLIVSTLYFWITPLGAAGKEILDRTKPDTLDVLVAIFGGIAGIVAVSRKEITNAIPGVAIATALMPPLCVAGYGIAKWDWAIFAGSFYLFIMNSVFIALSTYAIVRFLGFNTVGFVDEKARRKTLTFMGLFVILLIVPSFFFFVNGIQDFRRTSRIEAFIDQKINQTKRHRVTNYEYVPKDSLSELTLVIAGPPYTADSIAWLESKLDSFQLYDTKLHLMQSPEPVDAQTLTEQTAFETRMTMQPEIDRLQRQLDTLQQAVTISQQDTLPWLSLIPTVRNLFPELEEFSYGQVLQTDFDAKTDTVLSLNLKWKRGMRTSAMREKEAQLARWLQGELGDTVRFVNRY
jgi:uncharacterized hydrophobic protein (TIGR00271 family)